MLVYLKKKQINYSSFSEFVSELVPYRTLTNLKGLISQKLLDRNLIFTNILTEDTSLYNNIIYYLISVELLRNLASK